MSSLTSKNSSALDFFKISFSINASTVAGEDDVAVVMRNEADPPSGFDMHNLACSDHNALLRTVTLPLRCFVFSSSIRLFSKSGSMAKM